MIEPPERQWIDPKAFLEESTFRDIPLETDNIDLTELRNQQRLEFQPELTKAQNLEQEEYEVTDGLLYSVSKPYPTAAGYPRILLPKQFRKQVIKRSHDSVGHRGIAYTLNSVRAAYVWHAMRQNIKEQLRSALCALYTVVKDRNQPTLRCQSQWLHFKSGHLILQVPSKRPQMGILIC
jgi:hypothetical protein